MTRLTVLRDSDHRVQIKLCCIVFRKYLPDDIVCNVRSFKKYDMALNPSMEKFVASWGEMASKWCINRTVAEIHALYILSEQPLSVDDVASSLVFSRSNVSTSLREMESWGLISPVHVRGDRKQYYEAKKDLWEIFRIILDEQRRRVIGPAVATFQECLDEQIRTAPEDEYTAERMREVLSFFNAFNTLCNEFQRLPRGPIQNLFKLKATIRELFGQPNEDVD